MWGGFGWRRGWMGPWPGRGPFSYLPPWQRPGWVFGRGACWWLYGWPWGARWQYPWLAYPQYLYYYPPVQYPTYWYYPWFRPPYPWW